LRIGVVSDTHLPRFGRRLPDGLVAGLREAGVEQVLHLGDWTSMLAVELLEEIAPTDGVAGNNDPPELVERFGRRKVVEIDGVTIGLTHGDLGSGRTTPERAVATFADEPVPVSVVLFGHSHIPLLERRAVAGAPAAQLLLNPGSPTDKRRQPRHSWALLEIANGAAGAELRFFAR
jgi:uncharacterized protein